MAHNVKLILPDGDNKTWSDLPWDYEIVFQDTTAPNMSGYALMHINDEDGNTVYTSYFLWTDKDDCGLGLEEPYYYWRSNSEGESPQLHLYQDKCYSVYVVLYDKEDVLEREEVMTIQTVDGSISHSRRIIQHGTEDNISLDSLGTTVSIELTAPDGIEWRIVSGTAQ